MVYRRDGERHSEGHLLWCWRWQSQRSSMRRLCFTVATITTATITAATVPAITVATLTATTITVPLSGELSSNRGFAVACIAPPPHHRMRRHPRRTP